MKKQKKNTGYIVGCVILSVLLTFSTFFSLVVFGVYTENKIKGDVTAQTQVANDGTVVQDGAQQSVGNNSQNVSGGASSYVPNGTNQGTYTGSQNQSAAVNNAATNNNAQGTHSSSPNTNGTQTANNLLSTSKTNADIVQIYAELMNGAKSKNVGFKKVEYQELPDGPDERIISEGAENVSAGAINKLFGFIEDLGVFVPKEKAMADPYVHAKGDSDMSGFPVYSKAKGSYLTDPNGIKSYTYNVLANGNVKMGFFIVDESNPEPVAENSEVATSYTGAVFSPMSKARIDNTLNHPVVSVFATEIQYSLRYHDCYVEVEFNPNNMQIVNLTQVCNVAIKGSGKVVAIGVVGLEKQELYSTTLITDLQY